MIHAGRDLVVADLRAKIDALALGKGQRLGALAFGVPEIDTHLPDGGLKLGALHEVSEAGPAAAEHAAIAALFIAGILARLGSGPVLWCLRGQDLFAPALARAGLHPDRVIYCETWRDAEVLPAMEEGLAHRGLAAVVGEVSRLGLMPSRRLQLGAGASGVTALLIRPWRHRGEARQSADAEPTAATTRWRVSPAPSPALPVPGLHRARWRVELTRCRGGEPRSWLLEACDAKGRLALPADLANRQTAPQGRRRERERLAAVR
jgi:protein ImuA